MSVASNGTASTAGKLTVVKTEPMDVGVADAVIQNLNGVKKEEEVVEPDNEVPVSKQQAGTFKVKLSGFPKFYPLGEFKKLIKEELGLALSYICSPKRGNPWLHLVFSTADEQQKALAALDQYTWRKKVLTCCVVAPDPGGKRKPDSSAGTTEDSDTKKAKLDMTVEERVLMVTIPLHNMPYAEQLQKKMEELRALVLRLGDLLVRRNHLLAGWVEQQREKYGGLAFKLDEILPSPVIDAYRNKCELRAGINPDTQERTVGCRLEYFKEGKIGVGPADSFKHLPQRIREAVKIFQDYVRASDKAPFIVEQGEGYWRHLVARLTSNGDLMLVVVAHPQALTAEEVEALKEDLKDFFLNREGKACDVASLYFQQFTEKLVGVPAPQMERLYGKTHLQETVGGVTFHLSPSSYFQVNTSGAEVLYKAIIETVAPTEDTTVLDLCCGTGGIGLCIAKQCGQVFGIEYLVQNVEDAKYNAEKNGITNCEFIAGRVEDILPSIESKITGKTVVPILDPPRTGLNQKVLCQLRKMDNVKKMIYVCSNHKAPIRNFLDLCCPAGKCNMAGHPFVPTRTIPVDVAPHTMHTQMVILMERVDPATLPKAKLAPPTPRKLLRGGGRLRGMRGGHGGMRAPPLLPLRGRFMGMPPRGMPPMVMRRPSPLLRHPAPPMRHPPIPHMRRPAPLLRHPPAPPMRRPLAPPTRLGGYDGGYHRRAPPPPSHHDYAPQQHRQRMDFSSDELTLSRYSDFRRDVEDAIDSYSPRSLPAYRRAPMREPYPAPREYYAPPAPLSMLEREEMAYQAGITRGMGGGNPPFAPFRGGGRGKPGPLPMRGLKRGGARRGRGGRK